MRNIKFISIFAACGFVLSFVFGLFSHSSFLFILLRALIFSIVFVLLGILVSFIFNKFLLDSNSLGFESDDVSDTQRKEAAEANKPGQIIDVVVEDEELPASESDNHFVVGNNTQMLKKTDIGDTKNNEKGGMGSSANSGFVPMKGFENVAQPSVSNGGMQSAPAAGMTSGSGDSQGASVEQVVVSDDELDTLPDMENLDIADENESDNTSESYTDSEFVSSANMYKKSGSSAPEIKDAALIAKAISTALSEEN